MTGALPLASFRAQSRQPVWQSNSLPVTASTPGLTALASRLFCWKITFIMHLRAAARSARLTVEATRRQRLERALGTLKVMLPEVLKEGFRRQRLERALTCLVKNL